MKVVNFFAAALSVACFAAPAFADCESERSSLSACEAHADNRCHSDNECPVGEECRSGSCVESRNCEWEETSCFQSDRSGTGAGCTTSSGERGQVVRITEHCNLVNSCTSEHRDEEHSETVCE